MRTCRCGLCVLLRARSVSRNTASVLLRARSVSRNDVVCKRGVCQEMTCEEWSEMMWSASVLLREECVKKCEDVCVKK